MSKQMNVKRTDGRRVSRRCFITSFNGFQFVNLSRNIPIASAK